ncbi:MAG: hypothetical protein WAM39_07075 [Bryobacteraceae bacterium]
MTLHDFSNSVVGAEWIKPLAFASCLAPVMHLVWEGWKAGLDPNLIEMATRSTGDWTLNFLVLTLAISPLREIFRLPALVRFRRMLGLSSFSTDAFIF